MKTKFPQSERIQFYNLLYQLTKKIIMIVEGFRDRLFPNDEVILYANKLDYLTELYSYDIDNPKIVKNYYWGLDEIQEIEGNIKQTNEFKDVVSFVLKNVQPAVEVKPEQFKWTTELYTYIYSNFIRNKITNNPISDVEIAEIVETWISDYERRYDPVMFNGELWFKNLYIDNEEIIINENIIIHKVTEKNLIENLTLKEFKFLMEERGKGRFLNKQMNETAFITFKKDYPKYTPGQGFPSEMINEQINWELLLSLYEISAPYVTSYRFTPLSIMNSTITDYNQNPQETFSHKIVSYENITNLPLYIKSDETERFTKFVATIYPKLKGLARDSVLKGDALEIAQNKYLESLQKEKISAYRILTAITGLEALFTTGDGEINYKMKMRIACLFDFLNFESSAIKKYIGEAYNIRSLLIHGSGFQAQKDSKNNLLEMSQKEFHNILEILRISCIIYILLDYKKTALIQKLDSTMIDSKIRIEFKNELNDLLTKYPIITSKFLH